MRAVLALIAATVVLGATASAQTLGPQGGEQGPLRKQLWLIPTVNGRVLHANVMRPAGNGPFPLAIMNHGTNLNQRETMDVPAFPFVSDFLVARGYAVALPLRRGFGGQGTFDESHGNCRNPDFVGAGLEAARDIEATLNFMLQQPFVKKDNRAIVLGVSTGGWATLAFASRNPPAVAGYVNFAGGRGGRFGGQANVLCNGDALIAAAGEYGRTARTPTLWLYSANDSSFSPALASKMFAAYRSRGGRGQLVDLPALGDEGHALVRVQDGVRLWAPPLDRFLREMQ